MAIAEECLKRPVQSFLPVNDAGRDGAFVGRWNGTNQDGGKSTIQCKFTSVAGKKLYLSALGDEIAKVANLVKQGLADDYVILTNHEITGNSAIQIEAAFERAGVKNCQVLGNSWINTQIHGSARLRMLAPRLYGMGDLSQFLDERAYRQAEMILSTMGSDLQRLVVTEAYRKSVTAISDHSLVLLLGAPAAGKSTIGASIAVGAADRWKCATIRATTPEEVRAHIDPDVRQFFWIDDAWGNTQYQRQSAEDWNRVFPLMTGAIHRGSKFLVTSRDYIWRAAQNDLKLQALPVLKRSQVVIDVHQLTIEERAQILYNHLRMGDQPSTFRRDLKPSLPALASRADFLPETARRLSLKFFAGSLAVLPYTLDKFFSRPEQFLFETVQNLSDACKAAIATVFLAGGKVRSPLEPEAFNAAAQAFGVTPAEIRAELGSLDGSLLLLALDDDGHYWTYKHPTVSDAFSRFVAGTPEMVEIYLRGARPASIASEVACAGIDIAGKPVVVANKLLPLLLERMLTLPDSTLRTFISYRSNPRFTAMLLDKRPDIASVDFYAPIADDLDTGFVLSLQNQNLLPITLRDRFAGAVTRAAMESGDASVYEEPRVRDLLTDEEFAEMEEALRLDFPTTLKSLISTHQEQWEGDVDPEEHFDQLSKSLESLISNAIEPHRQDEIAKDFSARLRTAIDDLRRTYEQREPDETLVAASRSAESGPLSELFRDVDA
ncbi:AAA family ATPase [Rhizobium laguerreae]|uniref:AAA family ATPase n=1 Tax=Rhizobium laguerreae TaxID=1076926 RepID=UPI001C90DAB0|nr:AAA family ATPase [Rhizobium laguerreae]MBY3359311.1 AAA family ATPase [Rhizobium laguerreae]